MFDFVAEENGISNFAHRFATVAALLLKREVGFLFGDAKIALENTCGVFDEFSRAYELGSLRGFVVAAHGVDFGSDEKTDGGDELSFALCVSMWLAMLDVDHTDDAVAAQNRHGEKSLEEVLRELVEALKARVLGSVPGEGDGLLVFGDPAGDSLPHAELEPIDHFGVRVLRGAEDEFVPFENVDEAGVALHHRSDELEDAQQYFVKRIGGGDAFTEFMQEINILRFACARGRLHVHTRLLSAAWRRAPIQVSARCDSISEWKY